MITVVVRVWMPDRPGALGQVASRIGAVRGDVLGIEILERGADRVVDELTVALASEELVGLLSREIDAVEDVSVEDVRVVDTALADANLVALNAGVAMVEATLSDRNDVLTNSVHRLLEADWTVACRGDDVVAGVDTPPDLAWLLAFVAGSGHLDEADEALPGDLALARLPSAGLTVAAGRSGRAIHERERLRVSMLARLADALAANPTPM